MFKNRALQVKMVKDASEEENTYEDFVTAIYSTEIVVNRTMKTAFRGVITLIGVKTASELALHAARTYIK